MSADEPLTPKQEEAAGLIRADPARSDRSIGRELGCSEHTVAAARRKIMGAAPEARVTTVPVRRCRYDGMQSRVATDGGLVKEYTESVKIGDPFPPIKVFDDGQHLWLADGIHTLLAHVAADRAEIKAEVRTGTKEDAWLASRSANSTHGLRRTKEDIRHVVRSMLLHPSFGLEGSAPEKDRWSARFVANKCDVSHGAVNAMVKEFRETGTIDPHGTSGAYYSRHKDRAAGDSGPAAAPQVDSASAPDPERTEGGTALSDAPAPEHDADSVEVEVPPAEPSGQAEPPGYQGLRGKAKVAAREALATLVRNLSRLHLYVPNQTALESLSRQIEEA